MTIEDALTAALVAAVPSVSGRVGPATVPIGKVFPLLRYRLYDLKRQKNLKGTFTGVYESYFQLEYWASTYTEAKACAKEGSLFFESFGRGRLGGNDGVDVSACYLVPPEFDARQDELDKKIAIQSICLRHKA